VRPWASLVCSCGIGRPSLTLLSSPPL
jgi:hypothetical protein